MTNIGKKFPTSGVIRQVFRYVLNCGVSLGVKVLLSHLFFLFMSEQIAYAVVQIPLFLFSYFLHATRTFKTELSWVGMFAYLRVVFVFQLLDYGVFTLAFSKFEIQSTVSVLIATLVIFIVRFYFVRRGFGMHLKESE